VTPSPLQRRAARLATGLWVTPERLRSTVAAQLDRGAPTDAGTVIAALEATATPDRPLPDDAAVQRTVGRLRALGAEVLLAGEAGYPSRLADAWPELGAPLWVFVRSPAGLPAGPAVAVVGTRRPSADGLHTARELAMLLAEHGVTVVSGLARGIDQAAHRGALEAGGQTVAVLGTGLDVLYPSGSRELHDAIAASGGLVSEYPPGTGPRPHHFLWRNRLISGLADATVVVEGRARSGALQTARLAAAQGRDVLAVPGSLHAPASQGPLELIRDGAQPLTSLDEVLAVVGLAPGGADHPPRSPAPLAPDTAAVHDLLGAVPSTPGALAAASGLAVGAVLAAVGELVELGLAQHGPRGVVRTAEAQEQR
jgi:DNA processing protein